MRDVLIGSTDYTVLVKIVGTDGAPETGLAHTDIDIAYSRVETDNDVTTSDVAPADLANLTAAHSDWGWEEVSATDHPGLYRLDIADAVFASGAWEAVVTITDASGTDFYPVDIGFRLVSFNTQDGVRLGLTALPNAAAGADAGLPVLSSSATTLAYTISTLTTYTGNTPQTGDSYAIVNSGTHGNAALKTLIDAVDDIIDTEFAALVTTIGTAGAGLTNLPWNAAWDTEVQSEVQDALESNNLDHLVKAAVPVSFSASVHANSIIGHLAATSATTSFNRLTDALESQRDQANTFSTNIDAILTDTNELQTDWADGGRLDLILDARASQTSVNTIDDLLDTEVGALQTTLNALFTTALSESYRSAGAAPTMAQFAFETLAHLGDKSITSTTLTLYNLAHTAAKTFTLNDATTPTSITETT